MYSIVVRKYIVYPSTILVTLLFIFLLSSWVEDNFSKHRNKGSMSFSSYSFNVSRRQQETVITSVGKLNSVGIFDSGSTFSPIITSSYINEIIMRIHEEMKTNAIFYNTLNQLISSHKLNCLPRTHLLLAPTIFQLTLLDIFSFY